MSISSPRPSQGEFEPYNVDEFTPVNPEARSPSGERVQKTVQKELSIIKYAEKYKATTRDLSFQRIICDEVIPTYGSSIRLIRGDGNCGTTSFAVGLLYHFLNISDETNRNSAFEHTINLITELNYENAPSLGEDAVEVLGPLTGFQDDITEDYLKGALLHNDSFMLAFSRIVRAVGNQNAPRAMEAQLREFDLDEIAYVEEIISSTPGENTSIEAYKPLSLIFNVNIHVIDILGIAGSIITEYPDGGKGYISDITMIREDGHYISLISDRQTQINNGRTERPAPLRPPTDNVHPSEGLSARDGIRHLRKGRKKPRSNEEVTQVASRRMPSAAASVAGPSSATATRISPDTGNIQEPRANEEVTQVARRSIPSAASVAGPSSAARINPDTGNIQELRKRPRSKEQVTQVARRSIPAAASVAVAGPSSAARINPDTGNIQESGKRRTKPTTNEQGTQIARRRIPSATASVAGPSSAARVSSKIRRNILIVAGLSIIALISAILRLKGTEPSEET